MFEDRSKLEVLNALASLVSQAKARVENLVEKAVEAEAFGEIEEVDAIEWGPELAPLSVLMSMGVRATRFLQQKSGLAVYLQDLATRGVLPTDEEEAIRTLRAWNEAAEFVRSLLVQADVDVDRPPEERRAKLQELFQKVDNASRLVDQELRKVIGVPDDETVPMTAVFEWISEAESNENLISSLAASLHIELASFHDTRMQVLKDVQGLINQAHELLEENRRLKGAPVARGVVSPTPLVAHEVSKTKIAPEETNARLEAMQKGRKLYEKLTVVFGDRIPEDDEIIQAIELWRDLSKLGDIRELGSERASLAQMLFAGSRVLTDAYKRLPGSMRYEEILTLISAMLAELELSEVEEESSAEEEEPEEQDNGWEDSQGDED